MGLLTTQDKEIIKRALPKGSNKILDVAVARLYIAYPDRNKWKYTGLSGALVLVDDLVGNTFFLKLIDIYGHRGIIWDQELYVSFEYYQDRTFFHTFELEDCFAGFLFVDISEAQHFLKRVQKREKYGSRKTLMNKNAIAMKKKVTKEKAQNVSQGPRGETIMGDQRKRYNYKNVEHIPETRKKAPPPPPPSADTANTVDNDDDYDTYQNYSDEDAYDNDEVASSIQQSDDAREASVPSTTEVPSHTAPMIKHSIPPLPAEFAHPIGQAPPLPGQTPTQPQSKNPFPMPVPQPTQPQSNNPFPIPSMQQQTQVPPSFGNAAAQNGRPLPQVPGVAANSVPLPPRNVPQQPTFGAQTPRPPAFGMQLPPRTSNAPAPPPPRRGPAPPPPPHRQGGPTVPMGAITANNTNRPPIQPPVPRRGPVPPPPPRGGARTNIATQSPLPGALPPRSTMPIPGMAPATTTNNMGYAIPGMTQTQPTATPPMTTFNTGIETPTPPPTSFGMPMPPAQQPMAQAIPTPPPAPQMPQVFAAPPPAPPMPQASAVPPAPAMPQAPPMPQSMGVGAASAAPGPPPPPPAFLTQPQEGAPPPAPAPPPMGAPSTSMPETTGDTGRDALLASIRGAGGIGALKKVDKSQLDKPSVLLQEAKGQPVTTTSSSAPGGPPGGGPGGSLADALAAALSKRKNKVGNADDDDNADDW
ncbi:similar to Saccharomyces cerevisiae YOR181W LAS17 Actin assembly factor, activates the Arp2/3 protein complex that nucleates branched actin filaments [Maudiozyma saulgeensis]|uniref:Similar to Saccharomyces cerevisiae YOR181W LAS17 Actin assembly factor, activates the Arp2/3 protein complex that nucleates branched actin filaments n=1 Tax=Maudiozyma saulgeensis TaxID=1789683 RepID=A0A1X7R0V1_9SACH|nr:similar to Saccharomyces cerevisiae YOR181W LAS17 Actin assembly factor, activates the Arp2/3 protein complex that nucleates branched actin filaments [Kazachstania saulgeensis]